MASYSQTLHSLFISAGILGDEESDTSLGNIVRTSQDLYDGVPSVGIKPHTSTSGKENSDTCDKHSTPFLQCYRKLLSMYSTPEWVVDREKVAPPPQNAPEQNESTQSFFCQPCSKVIEGQTVKEHSSSIAHKMAAAQPGRGRAPGELGEDNRGFRMLRDTLGWQEGSGLGSSGQGIKEPPATVLKRDCAGLGSIKQRARVTHFVAGDARAVERGRPSKTDEVRRGRADKKKRNREKQNNFSIEYAPLPVVQEADVKKKEGEKRLKKLHKGHF
mmetsp:Transcript_22674/g.57789  ORF Transcript_22674/g.57789 Transcript_22674/m.57789 type:complete len:273 (-) Transcript_22674:58-876(-)